MSGIRAPESRSRVVDTVTVRAVAVSAFLFLFSLSGLFPFTLEPMSSTVSDTGTGTVATFRIENEGQDRVAIRVSVLSREVAEDGKETNQGTGDRFLVFPSRFVVEPGAQRAFKIQWRGGPVGEGEAAFRVIAEQVPVEFEKRDGSGITLLFRYVGALYVRPNGAKPAEIHLASVSGLNQGSFRGLEVLLENRGGIHSILADPVLEIETLPGFFTRIVGDALESLEGQNVLNGTRRRFLVPWEQAEEGSRYTGHFSYDAER